MKQPVFTYEAEVLTDAPFGHIAGRLMGLESPSALRCFRGLGRWLPLEADGQELRLQWSRRVLGTEESGMIRVRPDPKGAHLRLQGQLRGWGGFLRLGLVRWQTDRLLDRFVEEL